MNIGIITIVTGIYSEYFKAFIDSIDNFFPYDFKNVIVVSDHLKEYDDTYGKTYHIDVEEFIDIPYPLINMSKYQIVLHYAKKYHFDYIAYFDSDTIFLNRPDSFWDTLKNDILSNKIIYSNHPHYLSDFGDELNHFEDILKIPTEYTEYHAWGDGLYLDFDFINKHHTWIISSFFIISMSVLEEYAKKILILTQKANRELCRVMKMSDETHVNMIYYFDYLLDKTNENYVIKSYISRYSETINDDTFILQKYDNDVIKSLKKNVKANGIVIVYIDHIFEYDEFQALMKIFGQYAYDHRFILIHKESTSSDIAFWFMNKTMTSFTCSYSDSLIDNGNIFFTNNLYNTDILHVEEMINDRSKLLLVKNVKSVPNELILPDDIEYASDKDIIECMKFESMNYLYIKYDKLKKYLYNG